MRYAMWPVGVTIAAMTAVVTVALLTSARSTDCVEHCLRGPHGACGTVNLLGVDVPYCKAVCQ